MISKPRARVTLPMRACGTPASCRSKASAALGGTSHKKPRVRFGKQQHRVESSDRLSSACGTCVEVDSRAKAAGKGHLGDRDGQAAFAQVVAGADQARRESPRARAAKVRRATAGSTCGTWPPRSPWTRAKCEPPSSFFVVADQVNQVAGLLQIHRHAARDVVDLAQGADQQRRRNGDRLRSAVGVDDSGIRCSGCPCR